MFQYRSSFVETSNKFKKSKQKIKISKPALVFCFINYFFGFNTGITKCLKKNVLFARIIQIILITFVTVSLSLPAAKDLRYIINIVVGLQYVFCVFLFEFSKYKAYDLILDVHLIYEGSTITKERRLGIAALTSCFVWWGLKYILCNIFCKFSQQCEEFTLPPYIACLTPSIVEQIAIILSMTQWYIYFALEYFQNQSEKSAADLDSLKRLYSEIADCYDKIMPFYGKIIICELIVNLPKLMIVICLTIASVKFQDGFFVHFSQGVYLVHIIIQLCGPCFIAEAINSKFKEITLIFNNKMAEEQDKDKKIELSRFLDYMDTRNFQYKACRVVPLDLRLVTSLFRLCTTYIVVIIQFTHLL